MTQQPGPTAADRSREIDGLGPVATYRPRSPTELAELVRSARERQQAVYPVGGRTLLGYGLAPQREGIAVDLRALDRLIDYPARDMTVTVEAGMTAARLQELLAQENQRLTVDVPLAEQATIGGATAANVSGLRRYGLGSFRDYLLGASVVDGQGREIRAGGRVVKNVAGYDLCKLYIGSLGTLGILTQLTLKVRPRPDAQALLVIRCTADTIEAVLGRVDASRTRPVAVELLNPSGARELNRQSSQGVPDDSWCVVVGFEGSGQEVDWQVQQIKEELAHEARLGIEVRPGVQADSLSRALVDFLLAPAPAVIARATLRPSAATALCRQADQAPGSPALIAHAGSGIVTAHFGGDLPLEEIRGALDALLQSAVQADGNMVLWRCPTAWKAKVPVWGNPPGDLFLMQAVKHQLDPGGVLNPGRFITGI